MRFSHHFIKIFISIVVAFLFFIIVLTMLDKIFLLEKKSFHEIIVFAVGFISLIIFFLFLQFLNSIFSNFIVTNSNKKD